jgi:hypothetical protein
MAYVGIEVTGWNIDSGCPLMGSEVIVDEIWR